MEYQLKRVGGALLEPIKSHSWESRAVFNPGTVRVGDAVHMLYRAVEGANFSTIGYARLDSAGNVLERRDQPVICREWDVEKQGVEDPRIVPFDGSNYIFYTAFDGAHPERDANTRVMMAETKDFCSFSKLGVVGPPGMQDKDAFIFPETADGKVVYMHRIVPHIQIALFDSIEHFRHPEPGYWQEHLDHLEKYTVMAREFDWETKKIGAGPPPILTDAGWLLIYHGVDAKHVYRAGAALLDAKNPHKVIARLPYPIFQPEREYELFGDVNNVVFPEGLALFDDELQVFYGGADKVVAMAAGSISGLIDALWQHKK